jgi:hypothetical protein
LSILNPAEGKRENRSTLRIRAVMPVEVYDAAGLVLYGIGKLYDIGINCAGVETSVVMTKGQLCHLRFMLEKKYLIDASARIMRLGNRASKRYYGVKLENVDLMQVEDLKKFIERKIKEDPFNDKKEF